MISQLAFALQDLLMFVLVASYIFLGAFLYFGATTKQKWWAYGVLGVSLLGIHLSSYFMTDFPIF